MYLSAGGLLVQGCFHVDLCAGSAGVAGVAGEQAEEGVGREGQNCSFDSGERGVGDNGWEGVVGGWLGGGRGGVEEGGAGYLGGGREGFALPL